MAAALAFVDLETTGATAAADRITEIGIVLVDGAEVRHWSSLVNPETPISSFIEQLTGISDEMVADAPTFGALADEVMEMLAGRLFIAHNARFDYGFLMHEFKRTGLDFSATSLCTVKLSKRLYPHYAKHNLNSLIERHRLAVDGRHRALADAKLIHQFWEIAHRDAESEHIEAAIRELSAPPVSLEEAQAKAAKKSRSRQIAGSE